LNVLDSNIFAKGIFRFSNVGISAALTSIRFAVLFQFGQSVRH
jgi:hypothetical protein